MQYEPVNEHLWVSYANCGHSYATYTRALSYHCTPVDEEVYNQYLNEIKLKQLIAGK